LKLANELQFSRKVQLRTVLVHSLVDNFNDKRNNPKSLLPHVRTDIVSYLQESSSYIERMQLNYFTKPASQVFFKFSAGILENMYSGIGSEILFKPFSSNFSIGAEVYKVQKREFNRLFKNRDYKIETGHINLNYYFPKSKIISNLSIGKYLAGDIGYTLNISRRLESGFRAGIFFSRTNVSAYEFGEGSFDKGFYFQIPIDLFLNFYRPGYINFELRPLTRDGGQKLKQGDDLIGVIHSSSRSEILSDWNSFFYSN
jgi:hypothetical protein